MSPRKRGTSKENLGSRFHGKPWIPAFFQQPARHRIPKAKISVLNDEKEAPRKHRLGNLRGKII
ncbi:MAG: hypothetical protein AMJ94_14895 [Deltaproteobacteria bacterium SM23_61]|nr:MAG: hypothetical protein AMJ94_14895 [Deltaproteobacteria bacterium SM23_61]